MASKGAKGRKIGSNKVYCKFYESQGRETTNKRRKLRTYFRALWKKFRRRGEKPRTWERFLASTDKQSYKVYESIGGSEDAIRT